jgi:hypothetical protein
MPSQQHLVLLSRADPPLPLARLRAQNQVLDIRAGQLRFTLDEITRFLNEVMGLNLVERVYFYGVPVVDDVIRRSYLEQGYFLGKEFAQ